MLQDLTKKLKYFKTKLHIKQYKNKYSATYKGQYLIQYLLDVYLNNDKEDYIEDYEKSIDSTLQKMEERNWFSRVEQMTGMPVDNKREFAAAQLFGVMLYALNKEEKKQYFEQIKQPVVRYFIKQFYIGEKLTQQEYQEIQEEKLKNDN